jgi:hypothetical protein
MLALQQTAIIVGKKNGKREKERKIYVSKVKIISLTW